MADEALCTPAWLMVGATVSVPGVLEFADGRLAFTTDEERVFDAALSDVSDVTFPWYYFGGGAKLKVGTESYRLSFVRPNNASDIPGRLVARTGSATAALLTTGRKVRDIGEGRQAGKAWEVVLAMASESK